MIESLQVGTAQLNHRYHRFLTNQRQQTASFQWVYNIGFLSQFGSSHIFLCQFIIALNNKEPCLLRRPLLLKKIAKLNQIKFEIK